MFLGGQNLNVFLNKWIKVSGLTSTVPITEKIQNKEYYRVMLPLEANNYVERGTVAAYFDAKKFGAELINLRPGEGLQAICQFNDLKREQINPGYSGYLTTIVAYNCDAF